MRAAASTLTSFEVTVTCAGTTFANGEFVGVHSEAHRAPRFAPVETGFEEYLVESLFDGLGFDEARTGYDKRAHAVFDLVALDDGCGGPDYYDAGYKAMGAALQVSWDVGTSHY